MRSVAVPPNVPTKWVTVNEACQASGIEKSTIFRWQCEGKIRNEFRDGVEYIALSDFARALVEDVKHERFA